MDVETTEKQFKEIDKPKETLQDLNFEPEIREYGDRMPYVGETVLFKPHPKDEVARSNDNDDYIAAIVTRVWSNVCVNLKIIPDHGPMQDRASVTRIDANPSRYHFDYIYD